MASGSGRFKKYNKAVRSGERPASQAGRRRAKAPEYTDVIPF
jgi:hypothetical protein